MIPVTVLFDALEADLDDKFEDLGKPECELWDAQRFAASAMRESFLKKQTEELDSARTQRVALETFLKVNEEVGNSSRRALHEWEEELWGEFKSALWHFHHSSSSCPIISCWDAVVSNGCLGRGANRGANGTDFYTKLFSSKLSVSNPALYDVYRRCIGRSHLWSEAEETRFATFGPPVIVEDNAVSFALKDDRTARTIATEATLNMFFQRGISIAYENRLRRFFGIDLATQPDRNALLARLGSIDGSFSTIDLKSASDRIAPWLIRECIPKSIQVYLDACRARTTLLPDGSRVTLNMWSTMGNGYTFSLQTVLFACMVRAAFRYAEVNQITSHGDTSSKNWGVFGDDIIVPTGPVTRYVLALLDIAGFTVNSAKTFTEGPFRESCGHDYFQGQLVRPCYARTWSTEAALYSLLNRLNGWCLRHVDLPRLRSVLLRELRSKLGGRSPCYVPWYYPDSSGLYIPYCHAVVLLPKDPTLQGRKARVLGAKARRATVVEGCAIVENDRLSRKRIYNPAGLLISLIGGSVLGTQLVSLQGESLVLRQPPRCQHGEINGFIPFREDDVVAYERREDAVSIWDPPLGIRDGLSSIPRDWVVPPLTR